MDFLGTCVSTPSKPSVPQSASEVVLYCVLEKANLTQYFGDFIAQGGDDVQQLCEAGEDEFLEIMALVGMASKPLHVRRLQKTLQEWALFPEKFKIPLKKISSNQTHEVENGRSVQGQSLLRNLITQPPPELFHQSFQSQNKSCSPTSDTSDHETNNLQMDLMLQSNDNKLSDLQIQAIGQAASDHAKHLPLYAPKPLNIKKPLDREIEEAMSLPMDDDSRLELFRKYGAIYGRFDSKRSKTKQLNFHEMCVNEAAAQLCLHRPSLITRREDLFFQARQVVKEAGLQLTRVQYRSKDYPLNQSGDNDFVTPSKVPKISYSTDTEPSTNATSQNNGFSSPLNSLGLFQTPLSWGKNCSFNDCFPSPSSLLLPGREDSDDLKLTLKGDGELSLLEEGLKIARQYGMSALDEDSNKEKALKRQLHT